MSLNFFNFFLSYLKKNIYYEKNNFCSSNII
jgi:hypothetical protein